MKTRWAKMFVLIFRRNVAFVILLFTLSSLFMGLHVIERDNAIHDVGYSMGIFKKSTKLDTSTQSSSGLKQVDNQTILSKKLLKMSSCFQNATCGKEGDTQCISSASFRTSFECKHFMRLEQNTIGRTGNQMFRIAALLGIAYIHNYTVILDSSQDLAKWFDLPNLSGLKLEHDKRFHERTCCKFDEKVNNLSHATNWTLSGYFQSWKYFDGVEDIINAAFKLKANFTDRAGKLIRATVTPDTTVVCIHVRRKDFNSAAMAKRGYTMAPLDYIRKAVSYFRNKTQRVHFFVVSDDKPWCKTNLAWPNVTVSPFSTVGEDLALMVEADHVIVTSGSFGWWGAWLCGGEAVYWSGYPGNTTWLGNQTNYADYYPSHWVGLP